MTSPMLAQIAALKTTPTQGLQAQWRELFETESPNAYERLDSGDGTAARATGLARLLPDAAMGDAGALRAPRQLGQEWTGVRMGASVRRGPHGPPRDRILRPRRSV